MDRIESVGESFSNSSLPKRIRKKKSLSAGVFSSLLSEAKEADGTDFYPEDGEGGNGPLDELMGDITALGEALMKKPTLENVKRYRDQVRQFLKYVVAHVLQVEERTSGSNILKRKKYLLVKTIDRKLDSLAREFLSGQKEPIDLLGRINEVNGLLVDLLR